jgi:hypothetical protein
MATPRRDLYCRKGNRTFRNLSLIHRCPEKRPANGQKICYVFAATDKCAPGESSAIVDTRPFRSRQRVREAISGAILSHQKEQRRTDRGGQNDQSDNDRQTTTIVLFLSQIDQPQLSFAAERQPTSMF